MPCAPVHSRSQPTSAAPRRPMWARMHRCERISLSHRLFVLTAAIICQVLHSFPLTAVTDFAALSGDNNPIHLNSDFASKSIFGGIVVHGILVSSLFSTLFGRTLQGSIYLKQTMTFKKPVYVDTEVLARVEVLKLVNSKKGVILECYTRIYCGHEVLESEMAVDGVASVLLPLDKNKI